MRADWNQICCGVALWYELRNILWYFQINTNSGMRHPRVYRGSIWSSIKKNLYANTFFILKYDSYIVQVPIYKFLKKSWGSSFFDRQLGCNFLSNRCDISHLKVPRQHFGTLKTYFFHEIIKAHTYCNIWKSLKLLWSVLPGLLPLLYY